MNRTFVRKLKRCFSSVTLVTLIATLALSTAITAAASDQSQSATSSTWLLSSPGELRVGPPPDLAETRAELDQLQALADRRDAAALDRISYWDAGAPPYRWTQRAIKYAQSHGVVGPRFIRLTTLMNVAISDAVVAAADSQQTYNRARPASPARPLPCHATPGYPDERAAAAGCRRGGARLRVSVRRGPVRGMGHRGRALARRSWRSLSQRQHRRAGPGSPGR